MSSDDENVASFNPAAHKKLLSEINEIVKFQHIKKPTRNEPALKNSEFHLVKSKPSLDEEDNAVKSSKKKVSISSVAQTVQKNTKQKQIGKQLKNVFKQENVLAKPLEKVYADRIQRTIAYDNTRTKLARWDAVVTKNQNAPQLKFPLQNEKAHFKSKNDPEVSHFRYKSKIMMELEEIHNECFPKPAKDETAIDQPELLTLEEMKERRKELGRLKQKESQKIAKKRMQGKIKSKKYHKLKKRDELKKKMKEFEDLKVTNPEAALKELEKIEKQRVKERTTLRHKNTGTWAKNLQVRAKYDANVKQDLEAQLALGRELTQKNQQSDSSDSEDGEETVAASNGSGNPWLGSKKPEDELDEVFSGYRKFWEDHNSNEKKVKKIKADVKKVQKSSKKVDSEEDENDESDGNNDEPSDSQADDNESEEAEENSDEEPEQMSDDESDASGSDNGESSKFINDLFDEAEEKIGKKMESKFKSLKPQLVDKDSKKSKKGSKNKRKADAHDSSYLAFDKKAKLDDVDEALNEGSDEEKARTPSQALLKEVKWRKDQKKKFMKGSDDINPESFLSVKSKHLITAIPKSQELDDNDEEEDINKLSAANKMSLAEAFENDDIVNDFEEEVEAAERKKNKVEDTLMPGWGSWGGEGVKEKKHKYLKKVPDVKKKDRIIIREAPNEKLQKHLISTVPFPFKSVRDFEASMRLPVGRDFIPESAHRKLTLPSVVTKAGTVIEPMSEEILVQSVSTTSKFEKRKKTEKRGKKIKNRK